MTDTGTRGLVYKYWPYKRLNHRRRSRASSVSTSCEVTMLVYVVHLSNVDGNIYLLLVLAGTLISIKYQSMIRCTSILLVITILVLLHEMYMAVTVKC